MGFTELKIKEDEFKGKNIQSIESDTVIGKAEELKRLFDAPAQEVLKEKINALIDYLQSTGAASELGTSEICEGSGRTVAEQLSYLFREMQNISAGSIAVGSIEDDKLSNGEGQIKEVVAGLKEVLKSLEQDAPHNALVAWNATIGDDDEPDLRMKYLSTKQGACYAEESMGTAKFGTLPLNCGGTGNKDLASAPKNAFIVKRKPDSGEEYLGYVTNEQMTTTIGAVPKARKVNGHALSSDITLGRNDFELSITADTIPGATVLEPVISLRRNFFAQACFFRMYFKNGEALTAGTEYDICTFPGSFAPNARQALACAGMYDCAALVTADGTIKFRPRADINKGYSFYVSGCWMM